MGGGLGDWVAWVGWVRIAVRVVPRGGGRKGYKGCCLPGVAQLSAPLPTVAGGGGGGGGQGEGGASNGPLTSVRGLL